VSLQSNFGCHVFIVYFLIPVYSKRGCKDNKNVCKYQWVGISNGMALTSLHLVYVYLIFIV